MRLWIACWLLPERQFQFSMVLSRARRIVVCDGVNVSLCILTHPRGTQSWQGDRRNFLWRMSCSRLKGHSFAVAALLEIRNDPFFLFPFVSYFGTHGHRFF